MRQRIDDRAKKPSPTPLEKSFKEIVVGTGRAQEPYIIAFHYASDNVAGHGLGTLFGFFEVEIHDQDAAYIVNFLASVAKKEYFANPRRTPTDSFDAALHKINVALAEIVKHGNVSWLGHLHGAIAAINGNTLHFSATGEGELYLAREESFQSISQGLADTSSEPHPLKTFTEVSSGELFDGDLVIAFSPSIWSLFSPEDLMRSLNRLGPAGFEQFLRTALVNELPVAAAAILLCSAPVEIQTAPATKKESKKPAISLENVWSGKPFSEALESKSSVASAVRESTAKEPVQEEYTDKKTGHIYVQASLNESFEVSSSRWQENWGIFVHHFSLHTRSAHVGLKKTFRRIGKETNLMVSELGSRLAFARRASGRRLRLGKRILQSKWQGFQANRQRKSLDGLHENTASAPIRNFSSLPSEPLPPAAAAGKELSGIPTQGIHLRVRTIGFTAWETIVRGLRKMIGLTSQVYTLVSQFFRGLSPKARLITIITLFVIVGGALFLVLRKPIPQAPTIVTTETSTPTPPQKVFPPENEALATLLGNNRTLREGLDADLIALTHINGTPYLISGKSILNLETNESVTAPETLTLAAAMDDLDALFTLGQSGTLYLYSVTTKKFEKNTLPLPAKVSVDAIGSYLTYLYVLDQKTGTIYRFPRAEGGFGTPVTWSKETISSKNPETFSVYENVAFADATGKPLLYSRGKNIGVNFSGTITPVTANALTFDQKTGDLFALDQTNKRIVRWSTDGTLIKQYFHESFGDIDSILVSTDGSELLTTSQTKTQAWSLR